MLRLFNILDKIRHTEEHDPADRIDQLFVVIPIIPYQAESLQTVSFRLGACLRTDLLDGKTSETMTYEK